MWGTQEQLSAPHAALVNGTLVQSFEFDDVHRQGVLHVGAVTLPGCSQLRTFARVSAGVISFARRRRL